MTVGRGGSAASRDSFPKEVVTPLRYFLSAALDGNIEILARRVRKQRHLALDKYYFAPVDDLLSGVSADLNTPSGRLDK